MDLSLHDVVVPFKNHLKYLDETLNELFKSNQYTRYFKVKGLRIKGLFFILLVNTSLNEKTKLSIYKVSLDLRYFYMVFDFSNGYKWLEIFWRIRLEKCVNAIFRQGYFSTPLYVYRKAKVHPLTFYVGFSS